MTKHSLRQILTANSSVFQAYGKYMFNKYKLIINTNACEKINMEWLIDQLMK